MIVFQTINVIKFSPEENQLLPYVKCLEYLMARKRVGLVEKFHPCVKDFYLVPLLKEAPVPRPLREMGIG